LGSHALSDEFTVPLCRGHHRQLHQEGNEIAWWQGLKINALELARNFWEQTRAGSTAKQIVDAAPERDEIDWGCGSKK
jgi:hypothetical protein